MAGSKRTLRRLAGAPVVVDGQTLDLQTQVLIDTTRRMGIVQSEIVDASRRQMDADMEAIEPNEQELATVRDVVVPGPAGTTMHARVYGPKTTRGKPGLLVYFHGGGFVVGSIRSHDRPLRVLAHESGVVVAAIDYRLGPDAMFPAAVEDGLAAYEWARAHADDLGASGNRVGVGGDSAGGNIAAVVSHLAREKGITPAHQLLLYPAIDWSRSCETHRTFAKGFILEEARTFWFEKHYLHNLEERDDPRASPLRFPSFTGLPPATIVTAGFDILRDEGRLYGETLAQAGVPVDFCCERSLIHGFFNMAGIVDAARAANSRIAGRLREALG
jgi:acetyl esterase